ncbi:MAG: response regulator [Telluria sp.]
MNPQVLIVDDDVVSRMVLMHLVDGCGSVAITEAESAEEAWALVEGGLRPAIIFCDLRMPGLSGLELLERLRADGPRPQAPFVLVTSATEQETVEQARDYGVAGYLVKPFDGAQVAALMRPVLQPRREAPLATMERLAIGAERLQVYLGGFRAQVDAARSELAALLARGDHASLQARLGQLRAGSATLGLEDAAATLQACAESDLTAEILRRALDAVAAAVDDQLRQLR